MKTDINKLKYCELVDFCIKNKNIKKEEIPLVKQEEIKERKLKPLLNGKRL